jgi:hypothetical protein
MGQTDKSGRKITTIMLDTPQGHVNIVDPQGPWGRKTVPMAVAIATLTANNNNSAALGGYAQDTQSPCGRDRLHSRCKWPCNEQGDQK